MGSGFGYEMMEMGLPAWRGSNRPNLHTLMKKKSGREPLGGTVRACQAAPTPPQLPGNIRNDHQRSRLFSLQPPGNDGACLENTT